MRPQEIEDRSFQIIDEEVGEHPFTEEQYVVAKRVIHASADFEFRDTLRFHPGAIAAGLEALRAGRDIVVDVHMQRAGVSASLLQELGCALLCHIDDPEVAAAAKAEGTTRSATAMRKALREAPGAVVSVGNAPTALLEALRMVEAGEARPSLIVGVPVGFVSAADAKERLIGQQTVPYIGNVGRKGGTPIAVAVLNALLRLASGKHRIY
ncbi:MAG: precorrin-8X methylmutase [Nitrospinota bacterium]